jgi:hypothetical protein
MQQNENQGRDQFIINNPQNVNIGSQGKSSRPRTEQILINVVKTEVAGRLRQSLHNAVLMNLDKESHPDQVQRLWDAEVKTGIKKDKFISEETSILDIFDREDISGSLLILGKPGAGKTVTMLDLAKVLLERAEKQEDYPIPVIFNLTSWTDDQQSIFNWLISQLNIKYGLRIDIAKKLIIEYKLLPLFDGLDELKSGRQELCVIAINALLSSEVRPIAMVVCSREEEYKYYDTKLLLNGSITLKPLTYLQIRSYLSSIDRNDLWKAVAPFDDLLDLLSIPLFLNIAVLAEEELSIQEWRKQKSYKNRLSYLLNAYIRRMLIRKINSYSYKEKKPSIRKTQAWIIWLSKSLVKEYKNDFLIEELQPYLLNEKNKLSYKFYCLIYSILVSIPAVIFISVIILGILNSSRLLRINIYEPIPFSIILIFTFLVLLYLFTREFMNNIGLIDLLTLEKNQKILSEDEDIFNPTLFMKPTPLMKFMGVGYPVELGKSQKILSQDEDIFRPNQSMSKQYDRSKILKQYDKLKQIFIGIYCTNSLIIYWVIFLISFVNYAFLGFLLETSTSFIYMSFYCSFTKEEKPCVQHFFLSYVLFKSGNIPWNYTRFLDYATELLLLQRIGRSYRFIHRTLRDHFAEMSPEND